MLASKSSLSSSKSSNLHLPTVSKAIGRHPLLSPTPSYSSMASTNASENVSALKAKYTDYAMWLKASSRQNREPAFTHELLKHSLCQMGIDSTQAEQLVSTCTWYVYQFQKELGGDSEPTDQSGTSETKKSHQSSKKIHKKKHATKSKKTNLPREHSAESAATITSINKENLVLPGSLQSTRSKFPVLPAIYTSDPVLSPRSSRHVDFDNEQSIGKQKPSHWQSAILKARVLPKLRPTGTDSSGHGHSNITPSSTPNDLDLSSSQKNYQQNAGHTRSILRKQISSCSSVTSTDVGSRYRSRMLTPASTIIDEVPLGTKSQRLFGGSECFAQIMNELEEQKLQ